MKVDKSIAYWAEQLAERLMATDRMIVTVESCTGGGVSAVLTDIAGSSKWFERGFVTYSNLAKHELVGVPASLIDQYGAVSEPVASSMAEGGLANSPASCAISITGIAGPEGGTADKPVGTVCFGWAGFDLPTQVDTRCFEGDRGAVRYQSILYSLRESVRLLQH